MLKQIVIGSVLLIILLSGISFYYYENDTTQQPELVNDKSSNLISSTNSVEEAPSLFLKENKPAVDDTKKSISITIGDTALLINVPTAVNYGLDYQQPDTGSQMFEELSERSKDDPVAARVLAQQLQICNDAPESRDQLNKELQLIRSDAKFIGSPDQSQNYLFETKEEAEALEAQFIGDFEFCSTMTPEMIARSEEFFQRASDEGDFLSTLALENKGKEDGDWEQVLDNNWKLWREHGSPAALGTLSDIYSNDLVEGIQINNVPNRVTAHALNLVSTEFQFLFFSERVPTEQANLRVEYDDILSRTSSLLSPSENEQAEQLAIQFIVENKACCQLF